MRILHLPTAIAGNAWGLSQGERTLGLDSSVLVARDNKFGYPADIKLSVEKETHKFARYLKKWVAFFKIRNKFNVFHFNGGTSLLHSDISPWLHLFDLPFYPKNTKLFATYNGSDARQKLPPERLAKEPTLHYASDYSLGFNSLEKDKQRQNNIMKMSRHVHHIWAINPDLLHFLPSNKASFLPCTISNFEIDLHPPKFDKRLKILHAPSNRATKGSQYILEALSSLGRKYPNSFEVILVENVPHEKAKMMFRSADLIIDQILIGWYGSFAVETMLMGKPVVVRIAQEDLRFIPEKMREELKQSVIAADACTIESVLEKCILDRGMLKTIAANGVDYANKWHHPAYVASLTKAKYEEAVF